MIHRHTVSFKHAFDGLIWALKTQPNYKIHLTLAFLSVTAGMYFGISDIEFIIIFALIFVGLAIETFNTALEKTCDAISTSYNKDIGIAKDVSAGAMLMFAVGATVVALLIFLPRLLDLLYRLS